MIDPSGLAPWDGNDGSSCTFGCKKFVGFYVTLSLPGLDPDQESFRVRVPDGRWVQAWEFNGKLSSFEVCRMVGEYRRCHDTDPATAKAWSDYVGDVEDLIALAASIKQTSDVWKSLRPFRGSTKTNGLSGSKRRYYEWDYTHNEIEVYDKTGKHLGAMDPVTGQIKPTSVNPSRSINVK